MLFKTVFLVTLASLALAAPGGEYDHGDNNWGKNQCYMKYVTNYNVEKAYMTKTEEAYVTKTENEVHSYVTKIPTYIEKTIYETKQMTHVQTYPVTKVEEYPVTKPVVEEKQECKTVWKNNQWDYGN